MNPREATRRINLSQAPWTMHEFFAGSGLVWDWLQIMLEIQKRRSLLLIEKVTGLLSTNNGGFNE